MSVKFKSVIVLLLFAVPLGSSSLSAAIVTFDLTDPIGSNGFAGEALESAGTVTQFGITLDVSVVGTADPASFSAVTDSAGVNSDDDTTTETRNRIENGEFIEFQVSFDPQQLVISINSIDWRFQEGNVSAGDAATFQINSDPVLFFGSDSSDYDASDDIWSPSSVFAVSSGDTLRFGATDQVGLQAITFNATAVPEPSGLVAICVMGVVGLVRRGRRRTEKIRKG
ncbi:hypothetical protein FHS27_003899 [Rhodopirellula rubra]|uniref:PEP-CTERM protein-sorting domain-containing protein n=1 Tax=Aporhodopirellula rubra TaxID=980271 RepID=A0A7W5H616_9BACT|nr:hypothetical protein [Aporhodopirellula rubra]MBB3208072.1 hypothetical protein [Aporhodopirellula rubra]